MSKVKIWWRRRDSFAWMRRQNSRSSSAQCCQCFIEHEPTIADRRGLRVVCRRVTARAKHRRVKQCSVILLIASRVKRSTSLFSNSLNDNCSRRRYACTANPGQFQLCSSSLEHDVQYQCQTGQRAPVLLAQDALLLASKGLSQKENKQNKQKCNQWNIICLNVN